jgi:glycosidase
MKGMKPDEYIREPFIWDHGKKDPVQTSWEEPRYSTDQTVVPLSDQVGDSKSLFNFYKEWVTSRNESDVLTYGSVELSPTRMKEIVSYFRVRGDDRAFVIHNISDVEVTMPVDLNEIYRLDFGTKNGIELRETEIVMPAHSTAVLTN